MTFSATISQCSFKKEVKLSGKFFLVDCIDISTRYPIGAVVGKLAIHNFANFRMLFVAKNIFLLFFVQISNALSLDYRSLSYGDKHVWLRKSEHIYLLKDAFNSKTPLAQFSVSFFFTEARGLVITFLNFANANPEFEITLETICSLRGLLVFRNLIYLLSL